MSFICVVLLISLCVSHTTQAPFEIPEMDTDEYYDDELRYSNLLRNPGKSSDEKIEMLSTTEFPEKSKEGGFGNVLISGREIIDTAAKNLQTVEDEAEKGYEEVANSTKEIGMKAYSMGSNATKALVGGVSAEAKYLQDGTSNWFVGAWESFTGFFRNIELSIIEAFHVVSMIIVIVLAVIITVAVVRAALALKRLFTGCENELKSEAYKRVQQARAQRTQTQPTKCNQTESETKC